MTVPDYNLDVQLRFEETVKGLLELCRFLLIVITCIDPYFCQIVPGSICTIVVSLGGSCGAGTITKLLVLG